YGTYLGREEVWAVPTLGGSPRRVVSAKYVVPSQDGASIFYIKWDKPGIFRAGKSGLNEELVYKPEDTSWVFCPLLLFPGGNDLLAASLKVPPTSVHISKINLANHEAVDLGQISEVWGTNLFPPNVVWAEPGNSILFSRTVNWLTNIWNYNLR